MLETKKQIKNWLRRIRRYSRKIGIVNIPRIPKNLTKTMLEFPGRLIPFLVFNPTPEMKLGDGWIMTDGDYPELLAKPFESYWILWQAYNLYKDKSDFLGKDLGTEPIEKKYKNLIISSDVQVLIPNARESIIVYNSLNHLATRLFQDLEDAEWTRDNPLPMQPRCRTVLHIQKKPSGQIKFRVCAYNAVATGRKIPYRPILIFK